VIQITNDDRVVEVDRVALIEMAALQLKKAGCTLNMKQVTTCEMTLTVHCGKAMLAIETIQDMRQLPGAVDRLITAGIDRLPWHKKRRRRR
jgi:hypothetical protein